MEVEGEGAGFGGAGYADVYPDCVEGHGLLDEECRPHWEVYVATGGTLGGCCPASEFTVGVRWWYRYTGGTHYLCEARGGAECSCGVVDA